MALDSLWAGFKYQVGRDKEIMENKKLRIGHDFKSWFQPQLQRFKSFRLMMEAESKPREKREVKFILTELSMFGSADIFKMSVQIQT